MTDQRLSLPRSSILRLRGDFLHVKKEGRRIRGKAIALNWLIRPGHLRKMAIIVPKACGKAHERNLVKRRVREIYRTHQHHLPEELHSIWITQRGITRFDFAYLENEMLGLYQRAKLMPKPDQDSNVPNP